MRTPWCRWAGRGILLLLIAGCGSSESSEPPCPEPTFTSLHERVFSDERCAREGCHAGTRPKGGLDQTVAKDALHQALLSEGTHDGIAKVDFPNRVVPNAPDQSFLWLKVSMADPPGNGGRMPLNASLRQCDLDALETWIERGAQND